MKELRHDLDFTRTYGSMPASFEHRVQYALRRTEEEKPVKRPIFRTIAIVLALLTFATAACAAALSRTTELFAWIYGQDMEQELSAGELVVSGKSKQMGDVVYTLEDAVWTSEGLYATVTAKAAEGANVILMPEDYETDDPAGYLLHFSQDEVVPDDAPTYRQLAEAKGAKIIQVKAHFENAIDPSNEEINGDSGYFGLPQQDGSVTFAIEFEPFSVDMATLRGGECTVLIHLSTFERTLDGAFVDDNHLIEKWSVSVIPEG